MSDLFPDNRRAVEARRQAAYRGVSEAYEASRVEGRALFGLGDFGDLARGSATAGYDTAEAGGTAAYRSFAAINEGVRRATGWDPDPEENIRRAEEEFARSIERRRQRLAPDPQRASYAGEMLHGLGRIFTLAAAGGEAAVLRSAFAGAGSGVPVAHRLMAEGVDENVAWRAGGIEGVSMAALVAAPVALPSRAGTFWARFAERATTGASINALLGIGYRGSMNAYLASAGYGEQASRYQAFDGQSLMADIILGAAFGGAMGRRLRSDATALDVVRDTLGMETAPEAGGRSYGDFFESAIAAGASSARAHDYATQMAQIANRLTGEEHLDRATEAYEAGDLALARAHALMADALGEQEGAFLAEEWAREGGEDVVADSNAQAMAFAVESGRVAPTQAMRDAAMEIQNQRHARVNTAPGIPLNLDAEARHAESLARAERQFADGEEIDVGGVWADQDGSGFAPHDAARQIEAQNNAEETIRRVLEEEGFPELSREVEEYRARVRSMGGEIGPEEAKFSFGRRGVGETRGSEAFYDERLTASQNKAVEMARNGYSNAEIADEMDTSTTSVSVLLNQAKHRIPGLEIPPSQRGQPRGQWRGRPTVTIEQIVRLYNQLYRQGYRNRLGNPALGRTNINTLIAERLGLDVNNVAKRLHDYRRDLASGRVEGEPLFSLAEVQGFSSVAELEARAAEAFGADWAAIRDASGVMVAASHAELIDALKSNGLERLASRLTGREQAVHVPALKTTFMIADAIHADNVVGVILHEVGYHHGIKDFLGPRLYAELNRALTRMHAENHPLVVEAFARAELGSFGRSRGERRANMVEERGAYTVELASDPDSTLFGMSNDTSAIEARLANTRDGKVLEGKAAQADRALAWLMENAPDLPIVMRTLARIRQWILNKFGRRFSDTLSIEDIRQLAVLSLRRTAETLRREQAEMVTFTDDVRASQRPDAGQSGQGQRASVAELRSRFDPLGPDNPWEVAPISVEEVRRAMAEGATETRRFDDLNGDWTRQDHINRIATLAREGWDTPIDLTTRQGIADGSHRLAAAIVRGDETIATRSAPAGAFGNGDMPTPQALKVERDGERWQVVDASGAVVERLPPGASFRDANAALGRLRNAPDGGSAAARPALEGEVLPPSRGELAAVRAPLTDQQILQGLERGLPLMADRIGEQVFDIDTLLSAPNYRQVGNGAYEFFDPANGRVIETMPEGTPFSVVNDRYRQLFDAYQENRLTQQGRAPALPNASSIPDGGSAGGGQAPNGPNAGDGGDFPLFSMGRDRPTYSVSDSEMWPGMKILTSSEDFGPRPGYPFNRVTDTAHITYYETPQGWRVEQSWIPSNGRRQGRGIAMYEELIRRAREAGVNVISSSKTNDGSQGVYAALQRLGYTVTRRGKGGRFTVDTSVLPDTPLFSQSRQNRENLLGAKRDPIESPEYQERVRALRELYGRQGKAGSAEGRGSEGVRGVAGEPAGGRTRSQQLTDILSVSSIHLTARPEGRVVGGRGENLAVIDTPFANVLDDVLEAKPGADGGPTMFHFDVVDGSNPKDTRLPGVHLRLSRINDGAQGAKVGIWFYRQLIEWADRQGLPFYSDDLSVSRDAQNIYDALKKRGYIVETLGPKKRSSDGSLLPSNGLPVYRVTRGIEIEEPLTGAPLPRDDYRIDDPTLRERQQRIDEQRARQEAYDKASPIEQLLLDDPDMLMTDMGQPLFSFGPPRKRKVRDLIEMSEQAQAEAIAKKKAFDAAARCALRHGGSFVMRNAARRSVISTGNALSRAGAAQMRGMEYGLAASLPVAWGVSHLAAQNADPERYARNRAQGAFDSMRAEERRFSEEGYQAGRRAGLDAPTTYDDLEGEPLWDNVDVSRRAGDEEFSDEAAPWQEGPRDLANRGLEEGPWDDPNTFSAPSGGRTREGARVPPAPPGLGEEDTYDITRDLARLLSPDVNPPEDQE